MTNSRLKIVGTHSGIFHADEVVAIAILALRYDNQIRIIRSRTQRFLEPCDIVVDVGGGKYDHHMKGGNGVRDNGVPYASCGLIWRDFGRDVLIKLGCKENDLTCCFEAVDKNIIEPIDKIDNGITSCSIFEFIPNFVPNWDEDFKLLDDRFDDALACTTSILKRLIKKEISDYSSRTLLTNILSSNRNRIIELPCQSINWVELVTAHNEVSDNPVDFVIFPYSSGGYAAQAVPPSKDKIFEQRISFPKEWAGLTNKLPEATGVATAIFCHNNLFFVRAKNKEDAYKLCEIAIQNNN